MGLGLGGSLDWTKTRKSAILRKYVLSSLHLLSLFSLSFSLSQSLSLFLFALSLFALSTSLSLSLSLSLSHTHTHTHTLSLSLCLCLLPFCPLLTRSQLHRHRKLPHNYRAMLIAGNRRGLLAQVCHLYLSIHTRAYTLTLTGMSCISICRSIYTHTHTHTGMSFISICRSIYTHTHTHTDRYVIYIYLSIHTDTHTHTQICHLYLSIDLSYTGMLACDSKQQFCSSYI